MCITRRMYVADIVCALLDVVCMYVAGVVCALLDVVCTLHTLCVHY